MQRSTFRVNKYSKMSRKEHFAISHSFAEFSQCEKLNTCKQGGVPYKPVIIIQGHVVLC